MSTPGPLNGRNRTLFPTLPRGEVVGTFESYPEAQEAVDVLARADFPVDKVSILGSDLKSVERVTGKLTWGRVALAGAASGAWLGLFFGLLLIIFSPTVSLAFVLAALLIGAGFGMLWGLVSYGVNRRRRDFTSVQQVIASSYSVLVDTDLGNRARNLLQSGGAEQPAAASGWTPPAEPQHPSDPPAAPPAAAPPVAPPVAPPSGDDERPLA
jgi:hypothetical protein